MTDRNRISPVDHAETPPRLAPEAVKVLEGNRAAGLLWCSACSTWVHPTHFDIGSPVAARVYAGLGQ